MKKVLNTLVASVALCVASASAQARPDTPAPCPEECLDVVGFAIELATMLYQDAVADCHNDQACLDEAARVYALNIERAFDLYNECCVSIQ